MRTNVSTLVWLEHNQPGSIRNVARSGRNTPKSASVLFFMSL